MLYQNWLEKYFSGSYFNFAVHNLKWRLSIRYCESSNEDDSRTHCVSKQIENWIMYRKTKPCFSLKRVRILSYPKYIKYLLEYMMKIYDKDMMIMNYFLLRLTNENPGLICSWFHFQEFPHCRNLSALNWHILVWMVWYCSTGVTHPSIFNCSKSTIETLDHC